VSPSDALERTGTARVAGLLLAAGGSERMGSPKQLLQFGGASLVQRAAAALHACRCDACFVVVGAHRHEVVAELGDLLLETIPNPGWEEGIGSSIRCGVQTISARGDFDAILLSLADQPLVSREQLDRLLASFRTGDADIVASRYAGTVGVPAVFGRAHFAALAALRGNRGAKALLEAAGPDLASVAFEPAATDIDTPQDFERLSRGRGCS